MRTREIHLALSLLLASFSFAALPPASINYQGVLRGSSNAPLSGNYDMVFRFLDTPTAGNEILLDRHTSGSGGQLTVSGGLFNVQLGSGSVSDGSGPGTYTSLADVFRDYSTVFVEITVGSETLSPRIRVFSAGYALNASNLGGKDPTQFVDTSSTAQTKNGELVVYNSATAATTEIARNSLGITASGNVAGGRFVDGDGSGSAYVGYGDRGIDATGTEAGGKFADSNGSGLAYVAADDYGISASGDAVGGFFESLPGVGVIANGAWGIQATGSSPGGYGAILQATAAGGLGVYASGPGIGGQFDSATIGIKASSTYDTAGYFSSVYKGGYFLDSDNGVFSDVAYNTAGTSYGIRSNGIKSFVQNHPADKDKLIAYAAAEGDEAATYTRGTGRLVGGSARIRLGETFQWVTNPDIGLTAHLTPRAKPVPLSVESLSTTDLVVRGPEGENVVFDYIVYGLRVGFERIGIVQKKDHPAPLPWMESQESQLREDSQLARFTPLERFKAMRSETGETAALDLSRADALRNAIGVFDPSFPEVLDTASAGRKREMSSRNEPSRERLALARHASSAGGLPERSASQNETRLENPAAPFRERTGSEESLWMAVSENIEAGDVLVAVPNSDSLHKNLTAADPAVLGVAWGPAVEGRAPLATSGVVRCKVDAGYAPIEPGDWLVTSPTPGHAMRAAEAVPGRILGKALERLDSGTGLINVVIALH